MSFIKRILKKNKTPRTPNEFVNKFLKDLKKNRVQLEMIYDNQLILIIDSLQYVPSWFSIVDKKASDYPKGFVLSFTKESESFESSYASRKFSKLNTNEFLKIEESHNGIPVVTIAQFIPAVAKSIELAEKMKYFIETFYKFEENNPSILFNLRYLPNVPG